MKNQTRLHWIMEITGLGAELSAPLKWVPALYSYFTDAQQCTVLYCLILFVRKMRIIKTQQSGCSKDQIAAQRKTCPLINPMTQEAESTSTSRPARSPEWVPGYPESNVVRYTGRYILSVAVFLESVAVTLKHMPRSVRHGASKDDVVSFQFHPANMWFPGLERWLND